MIGNRKEKPRKGNGVNSTQLEADDATHDDNSTQFEADEAAHDGNSTQFEADEAAHDGNSTQFEADDAAHNGNSTRLGADDAVHDGNSTQLEESNNDDNRGQVADDAAGELPPYWTIGFDSCGVPYFQNSMTLVKQTAHPSLLLPPNWSEGVADGWVYYTNHSQQTTQWEHPALASQPSNTIHFL